MGVAVSVVAMMTRSSSETNKIERKTNRRRRLPGEEQEGETAEAPGMKGERGNDGLVVPSGVSLDAPEWQQTRGPPLVRLWLAPSAPD